MEHSTRRYTEIEIVVQLEQLTVIPTFPPAFNVWRHLVARIQAKAWLSQTYPFSSVRLP